VTRAADLSLDAEAAAALSRAATLAGDAGLASRLEELVSAYVPDREAAGSAPKLGRLHHRCATAPGGKGRGLRLPAGTAASTAFRERGNSWCR
jgi:hypothetical protein